VWPAWSPDGQEIANEDDRGGEDRSLWTMHPDGSQAKQLLDYKCTAHDGLDWSPDGRSIIYSALADGRLQLFDVSYRGGAPHPLATQQICSILKFRRTENGSHARA
jgi:Tol biopolymer transport system component